MEKLKKYILLIAIIIFINIISLFMFFPIVIYKGDKDLTFEVNEKYNDKGILVYYRGKKLEKYSQKNNININKIGNYKIVYNIKIGKNNKKYYRNVKVVDTKAPTILFKGDEKYILDYNSEYVDPGYEVFDNYDNSDNIQIVEKNNINTKKLGDYMAFTINNGKVKKGSNKYELPRVRISRTTTLSEFKSKVN